MSHITIIYPSLGILTVISLGYGGGKKPQVFSHLSEPEPGFCILLGLKFTLTSFASLKATYFHQVNILAAFLLEQHHSEQKTLKEVNFREGKVQPLQQITESMD